MKILLFFLEKASKLEVLPVLLCVGGVAGETKDIKFERETNNIKQTKKKKRNNMYFLFILIIIKLYDIIV